MGTTLDPGATPQTLSVDTRAVISLSVKTVQSVIYSHVIKLEKIGKIHRIFQLVLFAIK